MYLREKVGFTRAMLLIQDAPADELRGLVRFVVDLLWGEGEVTAQRGARRLERDKEWDCRDDLSEIAIAICESSFNPFPKAGQ